MNYFKYVLTLWMILLVNLTWGQNTPIQDSATSFYITSSEDSLLAFLNANKADVKSLINDYKSYRFNWAQLTSTLAGLILLFGLTWKLWLSGWLKNHIQEKAKDLADNLMEMKDTPILVLSSAAGKSTNDAFIANYFENKKFKNLKYLKIGSELKDTEGFKYKLVFANNEDGLLDKNLVRKYAGDKAIFYLGKAGTWDYAQDDTETQKKINYANSRAQIHGNLMSTLQFLSLTQPKIENA